MRRPPLVVARLFLVADQSLVAAAEVEPGGAVAQRPATGPVRMTLDDESLGVGRRLLAAARRVASPVAGQVSAEVAAHQHGVVGRRRPAVLDRPQLLLAQSRPGGVDLEAERLGGEVSAAPVQQTDAPRKDAPGRPVNVAAAAASVPVAVHRRLAVAREPSARPLQRTSARFEERKTVELHVLTRDKRYSTLSKIHDDIYIRYFVYCRVHRTRLVANGGRKGQNGGVTR